MDLMKLFKTQKILDERIVKEKGLEGQDLLDKKILSLQVELGELANELPEVFKFWSNKKNNYKKALEEYCDCLHFILSIGNELGIKYVELVNLDKDFENITEVFRDLFKWTVTLDFAIHGKAAFAFHTKKAYRNLITVFFRLEKLLGFTWQEVEQAYYEKNEINHQRQESGY